MCGLGTLTLNKTAATDLDLDAAASALALALDHRGGDATGLVAISAAGTCHVQKAVCGAKTFNAHRLPVAADTRALVVHTRFATQGSEAFNRNNHPVACGTALVAHNGVIWENVPRPIGAPEVDTWVLARAASECHKRQKGETATAHGQRVALALAAWEGSAAVAVAYRGKPYLVTARLDGSPLWSATAEGVTVCASTKDSVTAAFNALGIDLPVHTWQTQVTRKKRGRKKVRTLTHTQPRVTAMAEGDLCVWDSGMHTQATVTLPDHWRQRVQRYDSATSYSGSGYGYRYGDHGGSVVPATRTQDYDRTLNRVAQSMLAYDSAERCGVCDTWQDGPLLRYDGLPLCDDCDRAMQPDTATAKSERSEHEG